MIDDSPTIGDAFGRALEAYQTGADAYEFVERDDGYLDATSVGYYFTGYDDWSDQIQQVMEFVEGRVLDVGCGAGRIGLYLQEQGHEVIGIDVSPRAIDVCRDRGLRDARVLDISDVDADTLAGKFDTVLMCGNNFGLVGTQETASGVLDRLARVATDEATLIAQSRDPLVTERRAHRSYHELNRDRDRLPGAIRLRIRYDRYATLWYDYLFAGPETMRELVAPTAWRVTETIETDESPEYVGILETG